MAGARIASDPPATKLIIYGILDTHSPNPSGCERQAVVACIQDITHRKCKAEIADFKDVFDFTFATTCNFRNY